MSVSSIFTSLTWLAAVIRQRISREDRGEASDWRYHSACPLIADSVAISLVNRGELGPEDVMRSSNGTFLSDRGRKAFWEAWFRRLDTEMSHPEFSYKMAYRRMLEVQAAILALCA